MTCVIRLEAGINVEDRYLPPANDVWGKIRPTRGVCLHRGSAYPGRGVGKPPFRTRKAGGTHPTGILSCLFNFLVSDRTILWQNSMCHLPSAFSRWWTKRLMSSHLSAVSDNFYSLNLISWPLIDRSLFAVRVLLESTRCPLQYSSRTLCE